MSYERSVSARVISGVALASTSSTFRLLLVCLFLGALASVALFAPVANAATCNVTTSADNGAGSLREKMGDVTCDVINFSGATAITLSSSLSVTRTLTIDGIGTTVVISGNDSVRVFVMDSISATVQNLTISHGTDSLFGGGIIITSSTVYLNNVVLDNNHVTSAAAAGGAVYLASSTLHLSNSTLSNNSAPNTGAAGGAIFTQFNTVYVTNTTFVGNSALYYGGAIYNNGTLSIAKSTFSGNSTSVSSGVGGAIRTLGGSVTVFNSTFYNNQVSGVFSSGGGAIHEDSGTLNVYNSTLSNNRGNHGAGIHVAGGTANVKNTIIANGIYSAPNGGGECEGTLATNTNNLFQDGSCSAALSGDPTLGPLANNGGSTQTMALLPGSKAIDAGDDTTCNAAPISHADQRGAYRPIGAHCDIGAYESGYVFMPLINK